MEDLNTMKINNLEITCPLNANLLGNVMNKYHTKPTEYNGHFIMRFGYHSDPNALYMFGLPKGGVDFGISKNDVKSKIDAGIVVS